MADFDVIYQDSRDAGLSSRPSTSGRSITSSRSDTRRGLGERSDSIGGSIMHRITRRNSSNNAIARPVCLMKWLIAQKLIETLITLQ